MKAEREGGEQSLHNNDISQIMTMNTVNVDFCSYNTPQSPPRIPINLFLFFQLFYEKSEF